MRKVLYPFLAAILTLFFGSLVVEGLFPDKINTPIVIILILIGATGGLCLAIHLDRHPISYKNDKKYTAIFTALMWIMLALITLFLGYQALTCKEESQCRFVNSWDFGAR